MIKKFTVLKFFIVSFLILSISMPGFAAKKIYKKSFVDKQFHELEKKVRSKREIEFIAKKLSETRSFEEWPEDMDSDLRLYIAIKWFEQNHIKPAFGLLEIIGPQKNKSDLWLYYRSIALIHMGFARKALKQMRELELKHPKDEDYLYLKSIFFAETNDLVGAMRTLDFLIRKNKRNGKFYLQRGIFYLLAFDNDKALIDFNKAIKYLPKHETNKRQQAWLQAGLIYLKLKHDIKKGKEYLQKGIDLSPASELVRQLNQAMR